MSRLAYAILIHLDKLKPTMELQLSSLIELEVSIMKRMPKDTTIEFWVEEASKMELYFPKIYFSISCVISMLSFESSSGAKVISLLDIFISLCLLMHGKWDMKAKFLFQWHNISRTGMLEESEHYLMIKRVTSCLIKLKLIDRIVISDEDAQFISVSARIDIDYDSGAKSFKPGLFFEEFLNWTLTNKECQTMFKFVSVTHRLIDNLLALSTRCESLSDISDKKYSKRCDPLPMLQFDAKSVNEQVHHFFSTRSHITIVLPNIWCISKISDWYVKIDTEVPSPNVFHYEIPEKVINRNRKLFKASQLPHIKCCEKFYTITEIQRITVTEQKYSNLLQISIPNTSSYQSKNLTIYNTKSKFGSIRLSALNDSVIEKDSICTATLSTLMQCSRLVVLPSSFTMKNLTDALQLKQVFLSTGTILFSGSLCEADSILIQYFNVLQLHKDISQYDIEKITDFVESILANQFNISLGENVRTISKLLYARAEQDPVITSDQRRQLIYFNGGNGFWNTMHILEQFRELFSAADFEYFNSRLSSFYHCITQTLYPRYSEEIIIGGFQVYSILSSCMSGKQFHGGMDIKEVVCSLLDKMENIHFDSLFVHSIIFLIKTPMDLIDETFEMALDRKDENTAKSANVGEIPKAASSMDQIHSSSEKLYGRYELDYGEHSSQTTHQINPTTISSKLKLMERGLAEESVPDTNPNWKKSVHIFLKVLFAYVAAVNRLKKVRNVPPTQVVIVSTNWNNGENFNLTKQFDDFAVTIRHESLQSKQNDFSAEKVSSSILNIVEVSKPSDIILERLSQCDEDRLLCFEVPNVAESVGVSSISSAKLIHQASIDLCYNSYNAGAVYVLKGPACVSLTASEARFQATVVGKGIVTCRLYEIPSSMNASIFSSFVLSPDVRKCLIQVGVTKTFSFSNNKYWIHNLITLYFDNLNPHSSYGLVIESFDNLQLPVSTIFRTLPIPKVHSDYFLFSPFTAKDYETNTLRCQKLLRLTKHAKFSVPFLVAMYQPSYCGDLHDQRRKETIHFVREKSIMDELNRTIPILHQQPYVLDQQDLFSDTANENAHTSPENCLELNKFLSNIKYSARQYCFQAVSGGYQVTKRGTFCYISLNFAENDKCLKDTIEFLNDVVMFDEDVNVLFIFNCEFLVKFLRYSNSLKNWITEVSLKHHQELTQKLLETLFAWKIKKLGRDCKLVSTGNVSRLTVSMIGKTIPDSSIGDAVFPHNGSFVDDRSVGNQSIVTDIADRLANLSNEVNYSIVDRHNVIHMMIFPVHCNVLHNFGRDDDTVSSSGSTGTESFIAFPTGIIPLGGSLVVKILTEKEIASSNIKFRKANLEWYEAGRHLLAKEPVVYRLETVLIENPLANVICDDDSQSQSNMSSSVSADSLAYYEFRIQEIIEPVDMLQMTVGPIVGKVTTEDARILFEFNMLVEHLECLLRPIGYVDEGSIGSMIKENVDADKPVSFHFQNLRQNRKYEILLPRIYGQKVLGTFKTLPSFSLNIDIVIIGKHKFQNVPIVNELHSQYISHQILAIEQLRSLNTLELPVPPAPLIGSTWNLLCNHLQTKGSSSVASFHISPLTIFSLFWPKLRSILLQYGKRILNSNEDEDDEGDNENANASTNMGGSAALSDLYFDQLDMIIQDSIRVLWSSPAMRHVLANCSHYPLFNSQYVLPAFYSKENEDDVDDEEFAITRKIRKIYDAHIQSYVSNLYGPVEDEKKDNFRSWRLGSLLVVMIDMISSRSKIKKKSVGDDADGNVEKGEEEGGKESSKNVFSLGFLDRAQWKSLRTLALDKSITQIIIMFEDPLIPLTDIPTEFIAPNKVNKGEMIPWQPTVQDLQVFCKFWVDWINSVRINSGGMESRAVLFVSCSDIPFSTLIQDLKSGVKLYQLCIGSYQYNNGQTTSDIQIAGRQEFTMRGKLGSMRYFHAFQGQDYFTATPFGMDTGKTNSTSRAPSAKKLKSEQKSSFEYSTDSSGFAQLKILLDAWNPTSIWTNCSILDDASKVRDNEAIILVGPIIGVPYFVADTQDNSEGMNLSNTTKNMVKIPVLLELDRPSVVEIYIVPLFSKKSSKMKLTLQAMQATVITIGPLELQDRYTISMVSGVKSSVYSEFIINTHYDEHENNIVVLNCDLSQQLQQAPASVLLIDVFRRCQFPFHGINSIAHCNYQPNFESLISEYQYHVVLQRELFIYKKSTIISKELRKEVRELIMIFRNQFRDIFGRPSYREVLKYGMNLLIPQLTAFSPHNLYEYVNKNKIGLDELDDIQREEVGRNFCQALLQLIERRIVQEYVDQLRHFPDNIFRAVRKMNLQGIQKPIDAMDTSTENYSWKILVERDLALQVSNLKEVVGIEEPNKKAAAANTAQIGWEICWSEIEDDAIDAVLKQWLLEMFPAPCIWIPYISLNQQLSIEVVPAITNESISYVQSYLRLFDKLTADTEERVADTANSLHNRLIIIHDKLTSQDSVGNLVSITPESMQGCFWTFYQYLQTWKKTTDHIYHIISPSVVYGSRTFDIHVPNPEMNFQVHAIDSTYRSNEYDRRIKLAEKENILMPKKKSSGAAMKSKRAQKKKQEEEQKILNQIRQEVEEYMKSQVPDGYLFIQCHTMNMVTTIQKTVQAAINEVSVQPSLEMESSENISGKSMTGASEGADANADNNNDESLISNERVDEGSKLNTNHNDSSSIPLVDSSSTPTPPTTTIVHLVHTINQVSCTLCGDKLKGNLGSTSASSDEESQKYDLLQLPPWLFVYCPAFPRLADIPTVLTLTSTQVAFLRDEVWFIMRQDSSIHSILQQLQSHVYQSTIMQIYESSRLSELSRPEDLREVDFSIEGVTKSFLKEIILQVWNQVLPDDLKSYMFAICDDFILSYCWSKVYSNYLIAHYSSVLESVDEAAAWNAAQDAENDPISQLPSWEILCSSSKVFSESVEELCIYSLAMKTAFKMHSNKKYDYIKMKKSYETKIIEYLEKREDELQQKRYKEMREAGLDDAQSRVLQMLLKSGREKENSKKEKEAAAEKIPYSGPVLEPIRLTDEEEIEYVATFADEDSDLDEIDNLPNGKGDAELDPETKNLLDKARQDKQKENKKLTDQSPTLPPKFPTKNAIEEDDDDEDKPAGTRNGSGREDAAALQAERSKVQQDALLAILDAVFEQELKDAIELAANQLVQENISFVSKELNEMQHYEQAKIHIQRVKKLRQASRRIYGQRINIIG